MKIINSIYLRSVIFSAINEDIQIHRDSKNNHFFFEHYEFATEQEIEDFIRSIPYFGDGLKWFLSRRNDSGIIVSQEWINKFWINTWKWATSEKWLLWEVNFICDRSLSVREDRSKLDLPGSVA